MSSRPKKKRIRASHEPKFSTTKISRAGAIMTCHNCWEKGHNKSTCKKDPIPVVPKEKGKSSRPKKQQNMETVPEDNEILTFMHNPRDEMGALNSLGVFDDWRKNGSMVWNRSVNICIQIEIIQLSIAPFPPTITNDGKIEGRPPHLPMDVHPILIGT
ncbi:hypothetical protein Tco_0630586 [Tanacetum coccineum]